MLEGLDEDQVRAVTAQTNTAVTAGAGSGKTLVLSSRYAWLIMEKGLKTEEILSLTFTNKAANEMYSRIYGMLLEHRENEKVKKALENFHKANISTLDSFCSSVARIAAGRYGISPDFSIDQDGVRELALNEALPFALEHRSSPALRTLMAENKIRDVAEGLFAELALTRSSVSRPLPFGEYLARQFDYIFSRWDLTLKLVQKNMEAIIREMDAINKSASQTAARFREILKKPVPQTPDMKKLPALMGVFNPSGSSEEENSEAEKIKQETREYFGFLYNLKSVRTIASNSRELAGIKEYHDALKGSYDELESIAAYLLQADITAGVFSLLEKFNEAFRRKKREAGALSFNDVSRLAADALREHEDLRRMYEESLKAVMIDEFQDNNSLQRDLIFLIAKKGDAKKSASLETGDLHPGRLFFVGDEKQSIYRFRGADVSVFTSLARELAEAGPGGSLNLAHNYRSCPMLVAAYNWFFGGLLPEQDLEGDPEAAVFQPKNPETPYEASYTRLLAREELSPLHKAAVHFCLLDPDEMPKDDPYRLSSADLEAVFIARKILEMVKGKVKIKTRQGETVCEFRHFAVLQRTASSQGALEKQFRNSGIPYSADDPAGLFSDAPINDLYSFLRLMVYPEDRGAYAAVLRSPLTGLSDSGLAACLLSGTRPFAELPGNCLSPEDAEQYQRAGDLYRSMISDSRVLPVTGLLTKLWYHWGYRCETVWSAQAQVYEELFDFFFELARKSGEQGKTLADFLDVFDDVIQNDEKIKDLNIPAEGKTGVRIMTIHKSKGLEFPVVFLWRAGNYRTANSGKKLMYSNETWGFAVNLPSAEELPGGGRGNYFYDTGQKEEQDREKAELRRLLYVAMTRAESELYISAALRKRTKEEPQTETLQDRLEQLRERAPGQSQGFLDLLLPALTSPVGPSYLYTLEAIPVLSRSEVFRTGSQKASMAEAAAKAEEFYERAGSIESGAPLTPSLAASRIVYRPRNEAAAPREPGSERFDKLDSLLLKAKLEAADFGTLVHAVLEGRLSGQPPVIPQHILFRLETGKGFDLIRQEAETMAENFLGSDLGRRCAAAPRREAEFPVITAASAGGRVIPVTGQIDLLFEEEDAVWIVDFKTDRIAVPEDHYGQLGAYKRAVSDIFKKPVRAWLYYLRTRDGKAVEVTTGLEKIRLDELALAAWLNPCSED
ncbi:MAG: UvrD-helicase domain-containing protein [Treponema sp.]|nr:UvrD-helicase domain-containing protein [Treponema sp.]